MMSRNSVKVLNPSGIEGVSVTIKQNRSGEDFFTIADIGQLRYYGVFDGHGCGAKNTPEEASMHISLYLKDYLHYHIAAVLEGVNVDDQRAFSSAICDLYDSLDRELFKKGATFGSTCHVVVVTPRTIYQINLGDSCSAIIDSKSVIVSKAKTHIPSDRGEEDRIRECGGFVCQDKRVDGILAMSRAFGDYRFKTNDKGEYLDVTKVSCVPEIVSVSRKDSYVVILGTDGLYCDNIGVSDMVNILRGATLKESSRKLVEYCAKKNYDDDTTAIVFRV